MITSIDGATAIGGRSGGLGNATDREVLSALRRAADVVLVGAGTARGEGYGAPRKPGLRVAVVTNSGRLDPDHPLFAGGAGFAVAPDAADVPPGIEVLRAGTAEVDLVGALERLRQFVPGASFVTAEGGPRLNAALLGAGLVDELAVTTAPLLVGGPSGRLAVGAPESSQQFDLAHLLVDDEDYLFARWVRRPEHG
jgi:riboflavin biosynthesis pyrimidine reductase